MSTRAASRVRSVIWYFAVRSRRNDSLAHRAVRLNLLLAALLAALAVAMACGDDDGDTTATTTGTSTATASPAATEDGGSTDDTIEVTDMLGRTVEVPVGVQRIVALSPTAVEYVYAVGGTVVGRSSSVTFPAEAAAATDIGSAYTPSMEAVLALEPDLIVADAVIHAQPQLRSAIEALGVPVVFAGANSYQDVLDGIALMGQALGASERADTVIADIEAAKQEAADAMAASPATVVLLIADRDETLYAANAGSYAGDVFAQAGLTNVAGDQPDAGPFPGYSAVAPELLLQLDPDYIFAVTPAPEPAPRLSAILAQIPPFQGLTALTNGHVVELDPDIMLLAPGPRVADAFRALAAAVSGSGA